MKDKTSDIIVYGTCAYEDCFKLHCHIVTPISTLTKKNLFHNKQIEVSNLNLTSILDLKIKMLAIMQKSFRCRKLLSFTVSSQCVANFIDTTALHHKLMGCR